MNAIYARQSLDKKDSLSIESQVELCAAAAGNERQIYQDRGFSGKNIQRPAFQRMMQDVMEGRIQKIFVYRLDRFSRSLSDFSQVWKQLEVRGVQFESVTEKFDTSSPMGRAMLSIIMVFAQLERETTAERVRDNYYHRFQLGAWPGGPAPFGFRLGKVTDPEGRRVSALVPTDRAEDVLQIFQRYIQPEQSLGTVARWLTDRDIPGARRKNWDSAAVSRILHNPLYVMADEDVYWYFASKGVRCLQAPGEFQGAFACNVVGKRDRSRGKYTVSADQHLALANHLGIVPGGLWLACQRKLERNRQISRSAAGRHSWLSGLLKCGDCGYAIKINLLDQKYYLLCSGRSNLGVCNARHSLDLRELEQAVEQEIVKLLDQCPPERLPDEGGQEWEERLSRIDERIERLVQAVAAGGVLTARYLEEEISRLDRERRELLAERERNLNAALVGHIDFRGLDFEGKKLVARNLIRSIRLKGETVSICWNV